MILITGGMGFIALHVAAELAGHDDVVLTYHRTRREHGDVEKLVGAPVAMEQVNVENPYSLARAVARHRPDSIVHMAVPGLGALEPAEEIASAMTGLVNVLEAGRIAGVTRLTIASSVAVYWGLERGPYREDEPLPVGSASATSAMKKAAEVLALHYADRTGLNVALLRIGMVYGPLYHTLANVPSRLLHYAVKGRPLETERGQWDMGRLRVGLDLCYVKDCADAVARIHRAERMRHRIYNVSGGRTIPVSEILDAVTAAVPGVSFPAALREPAGEQRQAAHMDISRVSEEFGYIPRFPVAEGIGDYARWLHDHDL